MGVVRKTIDGLWQASFKNKTPLRIANRSSPTISTLFQKQSLVVCLFIGFKVLVHPDEVSANDHDCEVSAAESLLHSILLLFSNLLCQYK